jgi:hypothetical protein
MEIDPVSGLPLEMIAERERQAEPSENDGREALPEFLESEALRQLEAAMLKRLTGHIEALLAGDPGAAAILALASDIGLKRVRAEELAERIMRRRLFRSGERG